MNKLGLLNIISFSEKLGATAPTEILILKYGKNYFRTGLDKFSFDFNEKNADAIIKEFSEKGIDLNIDYEHQSLEKKEAPAAGWGKELVKTSEGLVLKMKEWTSKAKKYIEDKEYRYFSPVVLFDKNLQPSRLFNVALTNTPLMDNINALIASETFNFLNKPTNLKLNKGNGKMIQKLMMALGMAVAFSEKPKEEQEAGVMSRVKELLSSQEDVKGFLAMHEKPDFNSVTGMIQSMIPADKFNELQNKLVKRDAGEALALVMGEGKIADNFKGWALAFAEKDLEGFKEWSKNAPVVIPNSTGTGQKTAEKGGVVAFSESEEHVFNSCGLSVEDVKKYKGIK